jgi:hypothetical protein
MTTLYSWLLRLYPTSFRRRFGRDMLADFRDGYTAASRGGRLTALGFLVGAHTDLASSLLSQWRNSEPFVIGGAALLVAVSIWAGAFIVASLEWPDGPATLSFAVQLGLAVTACATLTIGMMLRTRKQS